MPDRSIEERGVHIWGCWEGVFTSEERIHDPIHSVDLQVEFTSPSGVRSSAPAFWDGETTWRVRFCPSEIGTWTYVTHAAPAAGGLHGQAGHFACVAYTGNNPLYRHGAVRVAPAHRHLAFADGTPFFYLGDTVWNGPLSATPEEWEYYLTDRVLKKFTAVQYLSTQFRGIPADREGRTAFTGIEHIAIDPAFFQSQDQRVDAINAHGLLAVPILMHAGRDTVLNPGHALPEDQIMVLTRYLVARYGAHHVLWDFLAEPTLDEARLPMWRRVGRAVFGDGAHHPVMVHPHSQDLALDAFGAEPWLDIVGYQSGHHIDEAGLRWITDGPPSTDWRREPTRPFINLEPPYEGYFAYRGYGGRQKVQTYDARRAIYWSLLVSPTAGVTYGAHGVWGWDDGSAPPFGHADTGTPPPWREGLRLPGATSMQHLATLMESLPWWRLLPAPELLSVQPGREDAHRTIVAARTDDGTTAIVYVPRDRAVALQLEGLVRPLRAMWLDPRTGGRHVASARLETNTWQAETPSDDDWVLVLEGLSGEVAEGR
jgi:hypothetical protein